MTSQPAMVAPRALGVRRPDRNLLVYYILESLLVGPFFPLVLVPRLLKFRTLRFDFSEGGISASWGVLFRREVSLGYARIQDIHLASNLVERWLGMARIQVQTASGSSSAEMTIEGLRDFEAVRDWIYGRMRGARGLGGATAAGHAPLSADDAAGAADATAATLREATAELRRMRQLLEAAASRRSGGPA